MAEHNLMDYSLLLITERNPDYKESDKVGSVRYNSIRSVKSANRQDSGNNLLKRQPSGIPEVQEDLEDEEDGSEVNYNDAIEKKLSGGLDSLMESGKSEQPLKPRVQTTAMPKLINIRDQEKLTQQDQMCSDTASVASSKPSNQARK